MDSSRNRIKIRLNYKAQTLLSECEFFATESNLRINRLIYQKLFLLFYFQEFYLWPLCLRSQRQEHRLILEYREKCVAEMFDAKRVIPSVVENYNDVKACIVFVKLRILLTI